MIMTMMILIILMMFMLKVTCSTIFIFASISKVGATVSFSNEVGVGSFCWGEESL